MSVSVYKNNTENCKYKLDKLANVIYLINEEAVRDIHIDNGHAYVDGIEQEPLALEVYNIELKENEELDERYKFTHTVTFSTVGYSNYYNLEGRYYVILKGMDGSYWLVNPLFPCKVGYTYTLTYNESHTDFNMSTVSNHPVLLVDEMELDWVEPFSCSGYTRGCGFKSLKLNESKYSARILNEARYTNDGFKDVEYNKNSAIFTEKFDGETVSHTLTFDINFDSYKSSWHYNLLEFADNTYAAIIETICGQYILTGFHFGLQPSFTVSAGDESTPNSIGITLSDSHDSGFMIGLLDELEIVEDPTKNWLFTEECDCVGVNRAKYILKKEVDAFGNDTGNFMCLSGYEQQFSNLNIVGTFSNTQVVNRARCKGCGIKADFPSTFSFSSTGSSSYHIRSDSDWSITTSDNHITVSPSSGEANTDYTVQVTNTLTPTATPNNSTLTLSYCDAAAVYDVIVSQKDCFTAGNSFSISANGQLVTVPVQCCVSDVTESTNTITDITILTTSIKVYVPQNDTGSERTFTLNVDFCDGTSGTVTIIQDDGFERWVYEGITCVNEKKCDIERKYTGLTSTDINTWTLDTRLVNCAASDYCKHYTRWIDSEETMCEDGLKWVVQYEEISYDEETWTQTGNKRKGDITVEDPDAECSEDTWYLTCCWICIGNDRYQQEQLYVNGVPQGEFRPSSVVERNAPECGGESHTTMYRWQLTNETICIGDDKYYLYKQQISTDSGTTWADVTPAVKSYNGYGDVTPVLAEADSPDCGWTPEPQYRWVNDGTTCYGTDKYNLEKKQVSNDSGSTWTDVVPRETRRGSLIEANSEDCGYVPPSEPQYKWEVSGYVCEECEGGSSSGDTNFKIRYTYNGSYTGTVIKDCDGNSTLLRSDYSLSYNNYLCEVTIGTCVTSIGDDTFFNANGLYKVEIPDSVTSIGDSAFTYCSGLIDFTLPNSITSIGNYAFSGCTQLNKINLPNNLTSLGNYAFKGCENFNTINIPSGITSIPLYCFADCDGMTDIAIPSGVTSIGDSAFSGCNALVNVWVNSTIPPTLGDSVFSDTHSNLKIYVPASAVNTYKSAAGWSNYADKIQAM